jgi:hypothetical protein
MAAGGGGVWGGGGIANFSAWRDPAASRRRRGQSGDDGGGGEGGGGMRARRRGEAGWEFGDVLWGRTWEEEVLALQWLRRRSDLLVAGSCASATGQSRVRVLRWDGDVGVMCVWVCDCLDISDLYVCVTVFMSVTYVCVCVWITRSVCVISRSVCVAMSVSNKCVCVCVVCVCVCVWISRTGAPASACGHAMAQLCVHQYDGVVSLCA